MGNTYQFGLPLLAASQAQKHVTVNEAIARLDAMAQLRVVSDAVATPPVTALDGEAYLVPSDATGDWSARAGEIAIWANGGWSYMAAKTGWQAWNESTSERMEFSGTAWVAAGGTGGSNGAVTTLRVDSVSHTLTAGGSSIVSAALPANGVVFGVTARVNTAITGSATGWSLGVAGSTNRYGSGLGLGQGSYALGLTGTPITYYSAEDLILTAEGGVFSGGVVEVAVHLLTITPPPAV